MELCIIPSLTSIQFFCNNIGSRVKVNTMSQTSPEINKPHFSGHDTFALRYGWLKKAYDAVAEQNGAGFSKDIFGDGAIARFGVGKNMVSAMRFWAKTAGIIEVGSNGTLTTTKFGDKIFDLKKGLDLYMENPTTLWLLHWKLSSCQNKATTWYWAFSHFSRADFDREGLETALMRLVDEQGWKISPTTIRNDVGCFINTYVANKSGKNVDRDSLLDCPLIELELIKSVDSKRYYFSRGLKPTLRSGIFAYALCEFWQRHQPTMATLSFENIVYGPGSPGRVFLLQERDVEKHLETIDEDTDGVLQWSETAGLRQVSIRAGNKVEAKLSLIDRDFASNSAKKVA